ncbi:MAG: SUMF1/EgtB/PvdO family nonheme iron enzyme [Magnetococcales bacterium]|nr:SUMF1/EgtB/PvdO family nonheme iron enzyme [Magnetococcales bacterium]
MKLPDFNSLIGKLPDLKQVLVNLSDFKTTLKKLSDLKTTLKKLPDYKTLLDKKGREALLVSAQNKFTELSSKRWAQISAGSLVFIASGLVVWWLTDEPDTKSLKKDKKKYVTRTVSGKKIVSLKRGVSSKELADTPERGVTPHQASTKKTSKSQTKYIGEGVMIIESIPSGADVLIDDKIVGETPYESERIPAGLYHIQVKKLYFTPELEAVRLEKNLTTKRSYILRNGVGKLSIISSPTAASISIDGKAKKIQTPAKFNQIKAGNHTLDLQYGPCAGLSIDFDLKHDQTLELDLALDGADKSLYEGECLTAKQILIKEKEKELIAEKIKKEVEKRLQLEALKIEQEEKEKRLKKAKNLLVNIQDDLKLGPLNIKDWEENLAIYLEVLTLDPENLVAKSGLEEVSEQYLHMAIVAAKRYDWRMAEENLNKVKKYNPDLESINIVQSEIDSGRRIEQERTPATAKKWRDPKTGMEFVWINTGCFYMGSDSAASDQKPRHDVCIDGFWLGKYEVTNRQFRKFRSTHNSKSWGEYTLNDNEQPAVYVSWEDSKKFADWMTKHSRGTYRLPTEAEWEYAARAGLQTDSYWGKAEDEACQHGNFLDPLTKDKFAWSWQEFQCEDDYFVTAPVGKFTSNRFGLHDMLGNACEWVSDWYDEHYYAKSQRNKPKGPERGFFKVSRGGCWNSGPQSTSFSYRRNYLPDYKVDYTGFRLVRKM